MSQKAVHIFLMISFLLLVGCGKAAEGVTEDKRLGTDSDFYDNPDQGIRIKAADGWVIEKVTAKGIKVKNEKLVAMISVIPKGKTVSEIKKELQKAAGNVTVTGEGLNFISWQSERQESIYTGVWIEEQSNRHVIVTIMTPNELYEENKAKIEAFRESIKLY
ncbi:MAG: hypothetical protein ACK4M9_13945 [Anaerobacillus sp.]|uniref:hypothetical protein n=1 Tax=Anaerobacillus sp. TaxID=1872506 RepID=UPI00391B7A2D